MVNAGKQEPDPSWTPDEVNDWWTALSPEYAALLQRQKDIHALSAMFNEKSTTATGRSLLVLDNSGDHFRAAVGSGDVDGAAHVLVYMPGMTTTVAGGLAGDDGQPGGSVKNTENIMEEVDPNWVDSDGRCSETVAGVLLVVAFAYATIYGCGTFLIEGIDPNTKPERFTGPRSDIPITQARADTLNLLLTIYDTLTHDHIVDAWVPPAPGPGGGGYQARIGGEYDQPVCPEGTTNEIYTRRSHRNHPGEPALRACGHPDRASGDLTRLHQGRWLRGLPQTHRRSTDRLLQLPGSKDHHRLPQGRRPRGMAVGHRRHPRLPAHHRPRPAGRRQRELGRLRAGRRAAAAVRARTAQAPRRP